MKKLKSYRIKHLFPKLFFMAAAAALLLLMPKDTSAQAQKTATMRVGRIWTAITDNGYRGNVTYGSGFFPNDYNILGIRGQYEQAYAGSGFQIGTLMFRNPYEKKDSTKMVDTVAIYGMINSYLPAGKVTKPITNFVRYGMTPLTVYNPTETKEVKMPAYATVDQSKLSEGTFDQKIEVQNEYVYGIKLDRKILGWSQSFNDNYIIYDYVFTNNSQQTYDNLFIQMNTNLDNGEYSLGSNPAPPDAEENVPTRTWMHYHGGRSEDTVMTFCAGTVPGKLRVFYEYNADDPDQAGDQMGSPSTTHQRLLGANMDFYTVLHASKEAYSDAALDEDDFLQPRITFTGNSKLFPSSTQGDPYGDKSFFAMRGGLNEFGLSRLSGNAFPGTRHSANTDELQLTRWHDYAVGDVSENFMYSSFGPYKIAPGQKIHIVYAAGWAGLDPKVAREVCKKWMDGTLENPKNMPDQNTGWLPSNFKFPTGNEIDKRKDRWVSSVIDSVMLASYRAKWNYDHNYQIPKAPPPPSTMVIYAYGDGTEIQWTDLEAESMQNFAGYRIMRRISNQDTTFYKEVYSSDASDKAATHSFIDKSVLALGQYYYYIQAKANIHANDVNADPTTRGKVIYSSRVLVPNVHWVNPPLPYQNDLNKVRIAPNPYNINDPLLKRYGNTDQRAINFYNLPVTCTIKIFTENGDLVQTLVHDSAVRAGSETWDMITSSRQVISSGVYIALIEKPNGEKTIVKFVVVR